MRLTLINQFYTPDLSPTAHLSDSLANHRAGLGDEVTVVASKGGYVAASGAAGSERESNPRVHRIWTPRLGKGNVVKRCIDYGTFYLLAAWRMLRLPAQDVIISLTTPPYIAWTAVLHKMLHRGTRLILWNMDCYPDVAERMGVIRPGGLLSRFLRWLNRRLFARIDRLVCLDTAMVDLLMSQYAPRRRALPVTVIPNWERASQFPADFDVEPWSKIDTLGLKDRFIVLYLGNTGYGHQFNTVLDVAHRLRGEQVAFLFIGGGQRWKWLEEQVEARHLDNVILHGYVPKEETPAVMAAAQCALITLSDKSLGIMSPSKLHSNLAMRLPVIYIGPTSGNVDDAIQSYNCGRTFAHDDVEGVIEFIRALMTDRALRETFQRQSRKAFETAYSDESTLPQFDSVIDGMHGSTKGGGASVATPAPKAISKAAIDGTQEMQETI